MQQQDSPRKDSTPDSNRLWAKLIGAKPLEGRSAQRHRLIHHLIDVGVTAQAIWDAENSSAKAAGIVNRLGFGTEEALRQWIGFMAAAHDIGKVHPCFQRKDPEFTEAEELCCKTVIGDPLPHGRTSACILMDYLAQKYRISEQSAREWAVMSGGHHGEFFGVLEVKARYRSPAPWKAIENELLDRLRGLFECSTCPAKLHTATAVAVAGLISVADWIASDSKNFPFPISEQVTEADYFIYAKGRALEAVRRLRWARPKTASGEIAFSGVFPAVESPRPLQTTVERALRERPDLRLLILEAPMGEGKTEAALYAAESWARQDGQRGFFFALPTMATANQMFSRLCSFLRDIEGGPEGAHLQLVHGQALFLSEFTARSEVSVDEGEGRKVHAESWFTFRKRGLLTPFGVGTIDQILRAAIRHRHVFVRLKGLAGKTVIIDEVHAYDTYMSTLLKRLLLWLRALDCRVILLSATLPRSKREELLEQFAPGSEESEKGILTYPVMSGAAESGERVAWSFSAASAEREIQMRQLPSVTGESLPQEWSRLFERLESGGCGAVVCNTVRSAQAIYAAIKGLPAWEKHCSLLHARFRLEDRQAIESAVLGRFGPRGERPQRHIVVATQIIEQSLDLDFDVMVSQLCPIDLLFQRMGRLHRHDGRVRPVAFEKAALYLAIDGEEPAFDRGTMAVYDEWVLLKTWLAVRERKGFLLPADIALLVDEVYERRTATADKWKERLEATERKLDKKKAENKSAAANVYLPFNTESACLADITAELEDDDLIGTRIGDFGVPLICLYPDERTAGWDDKPTQADVKLFVKKSLTLRTYELSGEDVKELNSGRPESWKANAVLSGYGLAKLNEEGQARLTSGKVLRLDSELGLRIAE